MSEQDIKEKVIQTAERYSTLEEMLTYGFDINWVIDRAKEKGINDPDPAAALARRILSTGAFKNLFAVMWDQSIGILRKVIAEPDTVLTEDEMTLLVSDLPDCVLLTWDDKAVIADDFAEQFRKLDTPEFNEQRKLNVWILDCLYMTHQGYGVLKDTEFLKMVSLNGTKLTIKEVKKIWQSLPSVRKYCQFESGYVFDPEFLNKKRYISLYGELRRKYPLRMPSLEEIDGLFAWNYPFRNPAYEKMKNYLRPLVTNRFDTYNLLIHLYNQISAEDKIESVLTILMEDKELEQLLDPSKTADLLMEIRATTRHWNLGGNTPKDLGINSRNALLI